VDPAARGNRLMEMVVALGEGNLAMDDATTPAT
jgi:hypothetical protein